MSLDLNILKTLVTNNAKAMDFISKYDTELFSFEMRDNAKFIIDFIKAYKTIPTKRTLLSRYEENSDELSAFWVELEKHQYDEKDFNFDLDLIKQRYKKRTIKSLSAIIDKAISDGEDPDDIIKELIIKVQKTKQVDSGRTHIQKAVGDYTEEFKNIYESRTNTSIESPVIKTHYSMLDSVTGGLRPAELILIGGETNSGKSMFLNNIATQMWMQENTPDTHPDDYSRGYSVLYFSLEMPYEDCYNRFIAKVADVPQNAINNGTLDEYQMQKIDKSLKFLENYQKAGNFFEIVDVPRGVTIEEVELRYQDALLKFKPDIVVIDYMGLMHDDNTKDQDWLKLGSIAAALHEFSRAHEVVMITAVQLTDIKRGQKTKEQDESQRVGPHRIGRSSHIMHHVNIGIQIETRNNERSLPDLKYHIIKNRRGPVAQGNLIKNFECAALYDVPFIDDIKQDNIKENIPELIKSIRDFKG